MKNQQSLLTPVMAEIALDALKAYLQAPPDSHGFSPVDRDIKLDKRRGEIIESTLKPLLVGYFTDSVSLADFKSQVDGINKRDPNRNPWGFTGFNGQMFFNMLTRTAKGQECDRELRGTIREPTNIEDAAALLRKFKAFVTRVGQQFVEKGGGLHSKPRESSVPYFVSYFWQIHNRDVWPIYYTSAVQAMASMNLWEKSGEIGNDYCTFKQLNEELVKFFADTEKRPFTLYNVEHVFWFMAERDPRSLAAQKKVRTLAGAVEIVVPADSQDENEGQIGDTASPGRSSDAETRQSIQIQAPIAEIGAQMGFHIWVPGADRVKVMEIVSTNAKRKFLDALPLNYDHNTLDTIRQIDVLWLKGRSMARAFEVEHTTAIYSGILRMADLLALQPNMQIRLHIVAPVERRDKVLREIKRPVFSLLDNGPLYNRCTFLSYDAVREITHQKFLSHMSDTILDEYEERAEEE
jgi:hypothetical protein